MRPDFRVLDAYLDLWQQLALGRPTDPGFIAALLEFAPYRASLQHYLRTEGVDAAELGSLLSSLGEPAAASQRPILQAFWQANRQAVQRLGYCFDIIFPLRRLNLTHALHQAGLGDRPIPAWLRIQPELAPEPYLLSDALVVDFFSLQIDPAGQIVIAGQTLAEYTARVLARML